MGDTENIYWKNREILEKQKATPIGTLSVQLKISRLVWLDGTLRLPKIEPCRFFGGGVLVYPESLGFTRG